jgi:hypothetical protein
MTRLLRVSLLITSVLVFILAACSSSGSVGSPPPVRPSPTPCVTVTPAVVRAITAESASVESAGQTTPAGGLPNDQSAPSVSEMATREAELAQHNRPVAVPTAGESNAVTLPICPTPTPAP